MEITLIRGLPGSGKTNLAQKQSEGFHPVISEHFFHPRGKYFPTHDTAFQRSAVEPLRYLSQQPFSEHIFVEGVLWDPTIILAAIDEMGGVDKVEVIELESDPFNPADLQRRSSMDVNEHHLRQMWEDFARLDENVIRLRSDRKKVLYHLQNLGRSVIPYASLDVREKEFVREQLVRARIRTVN